MRKYQNADKINFLVMPYQTRLFVSILIFSKCFIIELSDEQGIDFLINSNVNRIDFLCFLILF